ncbi:alpha/beta hydrolase family protein [Bradyrhizobium sp. BR 1432]|uniref:alpha/beta hydrolase family protein n=1 Tax=Bradyrhizobium sp. BR 1432 TaxID=3447966 RepID=UPI003EE7BB85
MDAALDDVFIDEISFPATDGYALTGTLFLPRGAKRHAVLINSATAVPRKIYRGFASYLAHRGCAVLTYDYRGIGNSRQPVVGYNRPKSLVGFKASMSDWAALDVTAAVRWMRERYHTLPLAYVGHSFGGQALGLIANNTDISRAAFVASQAATWRLMTSPEKYRVFAFMNFVGVPLVHALGYAPGWVGIGEDLPKGVFLQWAQWVSSPRYLFEFTAAGAGELCEVQGRIARAVLLGRSLGDAPRGRVAHQRVHRDQAGGVDGQTVRRRRQGHRPFRLLPPRSPQYAVARRRRMDPGRVRVR